MERVICTYCSEEILPGETYWECTCCDDVLCERCAERLREELYRSVLEAVPVPPKDQGH